MMSFWIILGVALGWWYGWQKTAMPFMRAMARLREAKGLYRSIEHETTETRTSIKLARLSACAISATIGGLAVAACRGVLILL
jgi:hypothetical protein